MSVFEHNPRARIFNPAQHPLVHDISSFGYSNGALPGISLLGDALDYIVAFMYPKYVGTFADMAALLAGWPTPSANDYAIVSDDGDGKAAGYVWQVIENTGAWQKRYDVDWSMEAILAETTNRTQYMYVHKFGMTDNDASGAALTGVNAGQHIYGGDVAGQNLILHANSANADTTGFIYAADNLAPQVDSTWSLGTNLLRWSNIFTDSITSGTLTMTGGSITDSSGTIDFGNENLTTTGTITGNIVSVTTSATFGTLSLASGSITDSSGAISFNDENLTTTGDIRATNGYFSNSVEVGPFAGNALILGAGSITDESGAISFGDENLTTTGTFSALSVTGTSFTEGGNLRLSANTLSSTNVDGDIILDPNGTGDIDLTAALTLAASITAASGTWTITSGQFNVDNLRLDGNTISSTDANGNVIVDPNGTGQIELGALTYPATDNSFTLGKTLQRWSQLWLSSSFEDGTDSFLVSAFMDLRSAYWRDAGRTQAVQAGDTLFWSGTQWLASVPDTEINHSSISGLTTGDAGHTQFVMLAGRSGGQTIQGGTAASENLTLESTAHATKGDIFFKDDLLPFTDASYSGGWSGTDIGDATHNIRDVYSKGEFHGFRVENYTNATLPASSGTKIGRLVYATDTDKVYIDNGVSLREIGGSGSGTVFVGSQYNIVIGSATDVTNGDATHSTFASWTQADGDRVLLLSTYASTENVTITKRVFLTGFGYESVITGTLTFSSTSDNSHFNNFRVTGDVTLNSGADGIFVNNIFLAASKTFVDNGSGNLLTGIQL